MHGNGCPGGGAPLGPGFACVLSALVCATALAQTAPGLRFHAVPGGGFQFDTGILRGTLRAGGKSLGLTPVVHIPSGTTICDKYGLLSHYRLFTANHRFGQEGAWSVASDATLRDDGSVEAHWPASNDLPFEMWVVYRWSGPATLDLETKVRPRIDLTGFESFLASYFAKQFTASMVYVKKPAGQGNRPGLMAAAESYGEWQMFPRDRGAISLIQDGRWKYPLYPVDWAIMPELARPLGVRSDGESNITAVLMAPASDCFAVSTPFETEKNHRSIYLSLFGRDIKAGETARARARLVIGVGLGEKEVLQAYKKYLHDLRKGP